jgi:hypothetical protein
MLRVKRGNTLISHALLWAARQRIWTPKEPLLLRAHGGEAYSGVWNFLCWCSFAPRVVVNLIFEKCREFHYFFPRFRLTSARDTVLVLDYDSGIAAISWVRFAHTGPNILRGHCPQALASGRPCRLVAQVALFVRVVLCTCKTLA